jgi:hypothetical protein
MSGTEGRVELLDGTQDIGTLYYVRNLEDALRATGRHFVHLMLTCYGPYRQTRKWRGRRFVYRTMYPGKPPR